MELLQIPPAKAKAAPAAIPKTHVIVEPKLDGVRVLVHACRGEVAITTRRKGQDGKYRQVQDTVKHLKHSGKLAEMSANGLTILDGELLVGDGGDVGKVMSVIGSKPERALEVQENHGFAYVSVFDVLYTHGADRRMLPLYTRTHWLDSLFLTTGGEDCWFRRTPRRNVYLQSSPDFLRKTAQDWIEEGYEGAVLKNPDSRYGGPNAWFKYKPLDGVVVDALVVGWRAGVDGNAGSVQVAVIDSATGKLRAIGFVSCGDKDEWVTLLGDKEMEEAAALKKVVTVQAQQWTKHGRLRHPQSNGLRADLSAPNTVAFDGFNSRVL